MPVKFRLGQCVATPDAIRAFADSREVPADYLVRHAAGDWGDLGADDKARNDEALGEGTRLFSAYNLKNGTRIWIITEADRSATTILLPDEY